MLLARIIKSRIVDAFNQGRYLYQNVGYIALMIGILLPVFYLGKEILSQIQMPIGFKWSLYMGISVGAVLLIDCSLSLMRRRFIRQGKRASEQALLAQYSHQWEGVETIHQMLAKIQQCFSTLYPQHLVGIYWRRKHAKKTLFKCYQDRLVGINTPSLLTLLGPSKIMMTLNDVKKAARFSKNTEEKNGFKGAYQLMKQHHIELFIPVKISIKLGVVIIFQSRKAIRLQSFQINQIELVLHQMVAHLHKKGHKINLERKALKLRELDKFYNYLVSYYVQYKKNSIHHMGDPLRKLWATFFKDVDVVIYKRNNKKDGVFSAIYSSNSSINHASVDLTEFMSIKSRDGMPATGDDLKACHEWQQIYKQRQSKSMHVFLLEFNQSYGYCITCYTKTHQNDYKKEDMFMLKQLNEIFNIIFKRDRSYEKIVKRKIYLGEILQNFIAGVIVCDHHLNIINFNTMAEELIGMSKDEVMNKHISCLYVIDQKFKLIEETFYSEDSEIIELVLKGDQKERECSLTTAVVNDQKSLMGVTGIITDIGQLKLLQKEIDKTTHLSSLGTMAAGIAHEIKNPLVPIKVMSEMLPKMWIDPVYRKRYIEVVDPQIDRINELCDSLIQLGKTIKIEKGIVNMQTMLNELDRMVGEHRKTYLGTIEFQNKVNSYVYGNKSQLIRLFHNLLINSLQSIDDRKDGEILLKTRFYGQEKIEVLVKDNGCGMEKKVLDKLYDPFFTTKLAGTGLGMSIVYKIVSDHGGKILVTSTPDIGTEVKVVLPLYKLSKKKTLV